MQRFRRDIKMAPEQTEHRTIKVLMRLVDSSTFSIMPSLPKQQAAAWSLPTRDCLCPHDNADEDYSNNPVILFRKNGRWGKVIVYSMIHGESIRFAAILHHLDDCPHVRPRSISTRMPSSDFGPTHDYVHSGPWGTIRPLPSLPAQLLSLHPSDLTVAAPHPTAHHDQVPLIVRLELHD